MIIIEVEGGNVTNVRGTNDYEVLDWDNLLGDIWTAGDTERTFNGLFSDTREYIKNQCPREYAKIQERIAEDRQRGVMPQVENS
jgi:hypothetical protein